MKRTLIKIDTGLFPEKIRSFINDADIYDSSCSPDARVYFIDKDDGYYLKVAKKGALLREKEMTNVFHSLNLGAQVMEYISDENDYMVTSRVAGEDCTHKNYTSDPKKLCDTIADIALMLHAENTGNLNLPDRTEEYFDFAKQRYRDGYFDKEFAIDIENADEAMRILESNRHLLIPECLIHGDYCLPNIILNNGKFSGFIDVDHAGFGNRHIDIFWGAWTLAYNFKTDRYTDRFFDAYGRDKIDTKALKTVLAAEVFG